MVAAHEQAETLHVVASIPEHQPRRGDPNYVLFNRAKARLKRQGLWHCVLNDHYCAGGPEAHHSSLEFSQINAADFQKVNEALGLHIADDAEFAAWAESPGNLEILCVAHHRTQYGVHALPEPLWNAVRFRRAGLEPAARSYTAAEWAARKSAKGSAVTS